MNTISIKVLGAPSMMPTVRISRALSFRIVRNLCSGTLKLLRRFALPLAIICAVATYVGIILDANLLIYPSALSAFLLCAIADHSRKGGEL